MSYTGVSHRINVSLKHLTQKPETVQRLRAIKGDGELNSEELMKLGLNQDILLMLQWLSALHQCSIPEAIEKALVTEFFVQSEQLDKASFYTIHNKCRVTSVSF